MTGKLCHMSSFTFSVTGRLCHLAKSLVFGSSYSFVLWSTVPGPLDGIQDEGREERTDEGPSPRNEGPAATRKRRLLQEFEGEGTPSVEGLRR